MRQATGATNTYGPARVLPASTQRISVPRFYYTLIDYIFARDIIIHCVVCFVLCEGFSSHSTIFVFFADRLGGLSPLCLP